MFFNLFSKKPASIETRSVALSKSPGMIGITGPESKEVTDMICLALLPGKASVRTFRPDSLVEAAVRAAFGWSEIVEHVDPVTSVSPLQVFDAFKASLPESVWVSHLNTIRSLANCDVFIIYDIQSPAVLDWIKESGGKTIGTPQATLSTDSIIGSDDMNIESIAKLVESL